MVKANRLIAARFPARSPRGAMFPGIIRQLFFDRPLRRDSTISGQILIHVLRFTGGLSPVCTEISSYIEERGTETNERRACPDDRPSSLFGITLRSTNIHDYFSRIGGGTSKFYTISYEHNRRRFDGNNLLPFDSFHKKYQCYFDIRKEEEIALHFHASMNSL